MNYIDMLSKLGTGSAHPGGFAATQEQFRKHPLPPRASILEVGCGTGRTSCFLADQGYTVTGIDIHQDMIQKAKKRAQAAGAAVDFLQADAHDLPFPDERFDAVIVESVTNFTEAAQSVGEYYRVLKSGGVLFDREIMICKAIPGDRLEQLCAFFGIRQFMRRDEWLHLLKESGFSKAEMLEFDVFTNEILKEHGVDHDPHEIVDEGAFLDASIWQAAFRHTELMTDNFEYLAFGVLRGVK